MPHKPHRPPEAVRAGLHGRCQGGLRGLRWVGPIRLADLRPQVAHHVRQARPPADLVERGRDGPRAAGGASPLIQWLAHSDSAPLSWTNERAARSANRWNSGEPLDASE